MSLSYLGKEWGFYPPHNSNAGLNIVSGRKAIASRILHLFLTQKGEDPIHPSLGIAPELFEPLSNYDPRYFVFYAEQEIWDWNRKAKIGIGGLSVTTTVYEESNTNGIAISVQFVPEGESTASVLTFGFWEYMGAVHSRSLDEFLDSVQLDGIRFRSLTK